MAMKCGNCGGNMEMTMASCGGRHQGHEYTCHNCWRREWHGNLGVEVEAKGGQKRTCSACGEVIYGTSRFISHVQANHDDDLGAVLSASERG